MQSVIHDVQSVIVDRSGQHNPRPLLGFLTAYVPEELFHAAGFIPVFVFHTPKDHGRARAHLPGFTCWVAGSALDQALTGSLDGLTGMALAQTCDTVQGLTDLWQRNVPQIPLFRFGMPLRLDGPSARSYLLAELQLLRERIQALTGRPAPDGALWESIALYNRTRALVRRLYARAVDLTPPDLYGLVQAAFQSPKQTYNDHLARLLELPSIPPNGENQERSPRVLLAGPALADPVLFDVLSQAGARVAGDLLDLGERYFAVDVLGPPRPSITPSVPVRPTCYRWWRNDRPTASSSPAKSSASPTALTMYNWPTHWTRQACLTCWSNWSRHRRPANCARGWRHLWK